MSGHSVRTSFGNCVQNRPGGTFSQPTRCRREWRHVSSHFECKTRETIEITLFKNIKILKDSSLISLALWRFSQQQLEGAREVFNVIIIFEYFRFLHSESHGNPNLNKNYQKIQKSCIPGKRLHNRS